MMNFAKLSELFEQAIQIQDPKEQASFIESSCTDSVDRRKLADLVRAHTQECPLVDKPDSVNEVAKSIATPEPYPREGSVIGNYRLLQEIGEGGMGHVFMADQLEPIRRRVAVKIIKSDMNSRHILARFEAEREALSRFDHPNITRIIDAGVTECGMPYFVMELVRGDSLIEYCDRNKLTIEERIGLLEQVCLAVHHAHQKGILHRDIKPANIMVTMHDGVAVPKVIDFGIAKALDQPLTQRTLFTRYGDMVGTPQYMSPEQAEQSGLDIDSRTDVYSLGVVLYELLTGTTPIEASTLEGMGILGVLEAVRDSDTETPSSRVTKTLPLDSETSLHRNLSGNRLGRLLRGELDWVTMKALAKDRSQRYDSAADMARDLRRYLAGDSVTAAAPTFFYLARKMYQRHRTICLSMAIAALLLIATSFVSLHWAISNGQLRKLATENAQELAIKSNRLEKVNEDLKQARDLARDAELRALTLANEKKEQAAYERALSRFLLSGLEDATLSDFPKSSLAGRSRNSESLKQVLSMIEDTVKKALESDGDAIVIPSTNVGVRREYHIMDGDVKLLGEPESLLEGQTGSGRLFPPGMPEFMREEQEQFFEILIAEYREEFGNDHPIVAALLLDHCARQLKFKSTNWAQIESRTREAQSILQTVESSDDANLGMQLKANCLLARALHGQGRIDEAEELMEETRSEIEAASDFLTSEESRALLELIRVN